MKQILKSGIRRLLASQGFAIVRVNSQQVRCTMDGALQALARRKHSFNTVIDIGASNGSWTRHLMRYFPVCQYLLIEAHPVYERDLSHFRDQHDNVHFVLAAAGETPGHIYFDASEPLGGQVSYSPYASNNIQVPVTTLDKEVQAKGLIGPYLIKLDTHGFEVPILKGASRTLSDTEVIVMECYNFRIAPECLLFHEMCDYLKGFGFRCIDLVDPLHRPYDESFWQMDLVFVRNERAEFAYQSYR